MSFVETTVSDLEARLVTVELGLKKYLRYEIERQAKKIQEPVTFLGFQLTDGMPLSTAVDKIRYKMHHGSPLDEDASWIKYHHNRRMDIYTKLKGLCIDDKAAKVLLSADDVAFIRKISTWAETNYDDSESLV